MKIIILLLPLVLSACLENEYKEKGELYQCFINGKAIYKSNIRPEERGGKWVKINGNTVKVDDCYCMGCIGF